MKRNKIKYLFLSVIICTILFLGACNKFDAPTDILKPNPSFAADPAISNVLPLNSANIPGLPLNSAIAGVREITIIGKFSKNIDSNWIYCGSQKATIKRLSANADTIVFYRPPGNGSYINIVTPAAKSLARYTYSLENPVIPFDISGLGTYLLMEQGANDTVWVVLQGYIYKVTPDGLSLPILFKDTSYFKQRPVTAPFYRKFFSDIKFGPRGSLYVTLIGTGSGQRSLYCINPDSSNPVVYTSSLVKTPTDTAKMVYDGNGNFYIGIKSSGLSLVRGSPTSLIADAVISTGDYSNFSFVEIHIFNGYLYAADFGRIVRSPINTDGTVGTEKIPVIDLSTQTDTIVRSCTLSSFHIANDGTIFVSLINNSNYSLFILENGTLTPYYRDNTILPTRVDQILWGKDSRYLYLSRGKFGLATSGRLYKVGMAKNDGTPFYGAQ
jgi:hypothetical protein